MMSLSERAAYIKGLADGLELDTDKKEARVIRELLDLVADMAQDVDDIGADLTDVYDAVEEMEESLSYVEHELFGGMLDDFADDMYEILCPNCGGEVQLDEDMVMGGDVVCPRCGEKIELEIDACDCGHHHD